MDCVQSALSHVVRHAAEYLLACTLVYLWAYMWHNLSAASPHLIAALTGFTLPVIFAPILHTFTIVLPYWGGEARPRSGSADSARGAPEEGEDRVQDGSEGRVAPRVSPKVPGRPHAPVAPVDFMAPEERLRRMQEELPRAVGSDDDVCT